MNQLAIFTTLLLLCALVCAGESLCNGWKIASSANLTVTGAEISKVNYDASSWYSVPKFPATILAGLLQQPKPLFDFELPYYRVPLDPQDTIFFSKNLDRVPKDWFPLNGSWWYRVEFTSPPGQPQSVPLRLTFQGINYRGNVWVDGVQMANDKNFIGTFRQLDVDFSVPAFETAHALAVEIFPPHDRVLPNPSHDIDLAMSFIDWAPYPPDVNMGLWRDVVLTTFPSRVAYYSLRNPLVNTTLTSPTTLSLWIMVEVSNPIGAELTGTVTASLTLPGCPTGSIITVTSPPITVRGRSDAVVIFDRKQFPELDLNFLSEQAMNQALWWPAQMGNPTLQEIQFSFRLDAPSLITKVGLRQVSDELTDQGHRLYRINGLPILIRGAGWSPELLQRHINDKTWIMNHINYIKDMGLNTVRLEGKFESDLYFDLMDAAGLIIMPGLACCDAWQHWNDWTDVQYTIAAASVRDQMRRLRRHPSMLTFLYSSDELPPQKVESMYLDVINETYWHQAALSLSSAADVNSKLTGESGVKMSGPYSWVPPNYWLEDTHLLGGAFGFLTEGGPGEAPMPVTSFASTVPDNVMWPINSYWDYHCANPNGVFNNLRYFTPPLNARYGDSDGVVSYLLKSQVAAYEAHRAMFEGYSRNKYTSTGVIQWMLNNAWPSMVWHLYDFFWTPGGSYFGTKKACEPLHVMYSYNDNTVWLINSQYVAVSEAINVTAQVVDASGSPLQAPISAVLNGIGSDAAVKALTIELKKFLPSLYFIRTTATIMKSAYLVSTNDYWLSNKPDVLDWNNSTFYNTACSSYANLTGLNTMPPAKVTSTSSHLAGMSHVTLTNQSPDAIAFFVYYRLITAPPLSEAMEDIAPIRWSDNYVTLFPGETRVITAQYDPAVKVFQDVFSWYNM